ncbi:alkylhydroperoxidase AhpD family core domain-containing protein [Amycolatopsis marina]|uniref:Alkylhydroperoxidase AhpD family core domain-containing protein n=1 Tax=Amycolatopsis marina TaxID=490629 RepID=A0A1I1BDY5_9PSEU|nr:carboxymuconolactone decarboxylase family protein [Amycolatopsis marina]SFB48579.1 alkylhydroperoxidase AhpD family core domain-containing protein [Amycolatopsis marina]
MSENTFAAHTVESAPLAAQRAMEATRKRFGYLPAPVARLATSPHLLDGFLKLSGLFETTTLDPLAREVVIMTVATRNGCHVCVAMHTAKLLAMGEEDDYSELAVALREQRAPADDRLAAVREFTIAVLTSAGAVGDAALRAFLAAGFSRQNALEVVLGIGAYTMSTLANRLTAAPLDEQLGSHAWSVEQPGRQARP